MAEQDGQRREGRTRIKRVPERGRYDRESIDAVLDSALVAHVGFVSEGLPYVIPMALARDDDRVLLHGSTASRLMKLLAGGSHVSIAVTHLDGVVVARSAFESSMNYRSAVLFGRAEAIVDPDEKLRALRTLTEHLIPGRWEEVRAPKPQELKATLILSVAIDAASAKIRTGPPEDDPGDLGSPVWAGEIPLRTESLDPIRDRQVDPNVPLPRSVRAFEARVVSWWEG